MCVIFDTLFQLIYIRQNDAPILWACLGFVSQTFKPKKTNQLQNFVGNFNNIFLTHCILGQLEYIFKMGVPFCLVYKNKKCVRKDNFFIENQYILIVFIMMSRIWQNKNKPYAIFLRKIWCITNSIPILRVYSDFNKANINWIYLVIIINDSNQIYGIIVTDRIIFSFNMWIIIRPKLLFIDTSKVAVLCYILCFN